MQTTLCPMGLLAIMALTGGASMGPPTVVRDRFDYVSAISDSWKRQTLHNLLEVRNGASRPEDAYTAVSYRGRWFWIDDRDHWSKQALSFLMMMFSLTEGGPASAAPLVTIQAR